MKLKPLLKENDTELSKILDSANKAFEKQYGFGLNLAEFRVAIEPAQPRPYPVFPPKFDKGLEIFLPKLKLEATPEWSPRKNILTVHIEVSINRKQTHTIKFDYINGKWDHMIYS